jgi:hypothetical protein
MLRRDGHCDWGGKDRPIENVNGLRASRDWGHGGELTKRAGEVKPRQLGDSSKDDPQGRFQDGAFEDAAEPGPSETIKGVISAPSLLSR